MAATDTTTAATTTLAYPDWSFIEDPEPVEDAMQQELAIEYIVGALRSHYRGHDDVLVSGAAGYLCYDRRTLTARVVPDCLVAFGVAAAAIRERNAYLIWEVGKAPDFVAEVASASTASNDLGRKRNLYARLGIPEYWRFDATGGSLYGSPLVGERLVGEEYRPYELHTDADGAIWAHSELLSLDFRWDGEMFRVRDPITGEDINTFSEERDAREMDRAAWFAAEARADAEHDARQQERAARRAVEAQAQTELQARLESEAQARALAEELERLRRQMGSRDD